VVLWRQLADFAVNYMAKGRLVYVEGRLRTRTWDAADGTKRRSVEVVADRFQALSSRRPADTAAQLAKGPSGIVPRRTHFARIDPTHPPSVQQPTESGNGLVGGT
jgi:single-strand DNA-binding protein